MRAYSLYSVLRSKTSLLTPTYLHVYYALHCVLALHEQLSPDLALTARDADAETRHGGQFQQLQHSFSIVNAALVHHCC